MTTVKWVDGRETTLSEDFLAKELAKYLAVKGTGKIHNASRLPRTIKRWSRSNPDERDDAVNMVKTVYKKLIEMPFEDFLETYVPRYEKFLAPVDGDLNLNPTALKNLKENVIREKYVSYDYDIYPHIKEATEIALGKRLLTWEEFVDQIKLELDIGEINAGEVKFKFTGKTVKPKRISFLESKGLYNVSEAGEVSSNVSQPIYYEELDEGDVYTKRTEYELQFTESEFQEWAKNTGIDPNKAYIKNLIMQYSVLGEKSFPREAFDPLAISSFIANGVFRLGKSKGLDLNLDVFVAAYPTLDVDLPMKQITESKAPTATTAGGAKPAKITARAKFQHATEKYSKDREQFAGLVVGRMKRLGDILE